MDMHTPSRRYQTTASASNQPRPRYEQLTPIKRKRPSWSPPFRLIFRIVIIGTLVLGAFYLFTHLPRAATNQPDTSNTQTNGNGQVTKGNPNFKSLTPAGKDMSWTHLTPPNSADFYAYTDTLEGVPIRVSEQPLPDNFVDSPKESLAQLAHDYNANRTITVSGTTVYIGSSLKGKQSLLFTTDSLLIMITADSTLNDQQWTKYVASLQ